TTLSKKQVKRATRTRKVFGLLTSFFFLLSFIFLVLVEVGNTYDKPVLRDTFFIKLDLSHIVPTSIPNAVLLNSIAETLGLHDFYQVGLWGFCEGYDNDGITHCSKPKSLYWFNPVEILLNELLSGATIAIPAEALQYLDIVKIVSHWMFGLFLTGAVLSVIMIFIAPLSVFTRWASLPIAILSFLTSLFITVATILATAMFIIFKIALTKVDSLNIGGLIGKQMFVFMWIAAVCSILAWLIQAGLCCFCASRRDVRLGKKTGSKKAY
ncbi:actin cortical patch SUR7/pH-response regulator pali, partial [Phyllosticta capitalensis]